MFVVLPSGTFNCQHRLRTLIESLVVGARGCCLLAHLLPLLNGVDALLDQRASCTRFLTRRCDSDRWVGAQSHATALAGYHDPQEPRRGPGFSHLQQQAIHTSYGVQTPLL